MQHLSYPSLAQAAGLWARIGLLSFGGPAGQIALMHRLLVEERRWLDESRFMHALNYCMLLPGPEAMQLAVYIGWLMHRTLGGVIAGILFMLPGVAAIMVLSWIYALHADAGPVEAVFFGLKAAVLVIVLQAVVRIGARALGNAGLVAIALTAFVAIFAFGVPFPLIVLGAGIVGYCGATMGLPALRVGYGRETQRPAARDDVSRTLLGNAASDHAPADAGRALLVSTFFLLLWLAPVALLLVTLGEGSVFARIASFFSIMAVVSFGGAYAVLAYVAQEAVQHFGWLTPEEMLDGLGMAETTPGPLIMVTQFVGFMAALREAEGMSPLWAGTLGGLLATWVTFMPCFAWIFIGAPFMERLRGNTVLAAALAAITAAVVGVIVNLGFWFGLHVLFDDLRSVNTHGLSLDLPVLATINAPAVGLVALAMLAALRTGLGTVAILALCALGGLALWSVGVI